jgi:hypothetical protein
MSTIHRLNNPHAITTEVVFGPGGVLKAERYDASDPTLNAWNYEPIFASVYTEEEQIAPTPIAYYAVCTTCAVIQPRPEPELPTAVPEPWLVVPVLFALVALVCVEKWMNRRRWGG